MTSTTAYWKASADALLPLLQTTFFHVSEVDGSGYYQDKYFNGTALNIQGCEGYSALFCGVATEKQAAAMTATLSDKSKFNLNFSVPTVSMANKFYAEKGYWKG